MVKLITQLSSEESIRLEEAGDKNYFKYFKESVVFLDLNRIESFYKHKIDGFILICMMSGDAYLIKSNIFKFEEFYKKSINQSIVNFN